jgi:hypothetical protein
VVFYLITNQLQIQTLIREICVADARTYSTGTEMKILSQNINKLICLVMKIDVYLYSTKKFKP